MNQRQINEIIKGHEQRNEELLRALQTKGIALDKGRSVEHHFWANNQREAALLAKELYGRGFIVLELTPVNTEDGSTVWNVVAGVEQTPSVAASGTISEDSLV